MKNPLPNLIDFFPIVILGNRKVYYYYIQNESEYHVDSRTIRSKLYEHKPAAIL